VNLRLRLSPDGKMLAMQVWGVPPGFNSLAVMPVAGGEPRVILQVRTPEMFGVGAIAWSPDMRYLYAARCSGLFAFGLGYNDHSEILRVPLDGGPAVTVGPPIEGIVRHLSLSPDGQRVLYQSHRTTGEVWALENFLPSTPPATPARR
jgi:WD40 repeat protein